MEWIALVLLVSALVAGLSAAGLAGPVAGLAHGISRGILCAASLQGGCDRGPPLEVAYGQEVAGLIRRSVPDLLYGPDMLGLPVDFRRCRSPACAESPGEGEVVESVAGEPVTLFTHVVDRRPDGGDLYAQLWAYYPESASLRDLPPLREKGYHPHDWESIQLRFGADGKVSQRVSSHAGYNHTKSNTNWGSDLGWGWLTDATELVGLRDAGGWGEYTGKALIAGGSHAGNAAGQISDRLYPSRTPAGRIRLVPLESIRESALATPARFDPITPPWRKRVWNDPEAEGTG